MTTRIEHMLLTCASIAGCTPVTALDLPAATGVLLIENPDQTPWAQGFEEPLSLRYVYQASDEPRHAVVLSYECPLKTLGVAAEIIDVGSTLLPAPDAIWVASLHAGIAAEWERVTELPEWVMGVQQRTMPPCYESVAAPTSLEVPAERFWLVASGDGYFVGSSTGTRVASVGQKLEAPVDLETPLAALARVDGTYYGLVEVNLSSGHSLELLAGNGLEDLTTTGATTAWSSPHGFFGRRSPSGHELVSITNTYFYFLYAGGVWSEPSKLPGGCPDTCGMDWNRAFGVGIIDTFIVGTDTADQLYFIGTDSVESVPIPNRETPRALFIRESDTILATNAGIYRLEGARSFEALPSFVDNKIVDVTALRDGMVVASSTELVVVDSTEAFVCRIDLGDRTPAAVRSIGDEILVFYSVANQLEVERFAPTDRNKCSDPP